MSEKKITSNQKLEKKEEKPLGSSNEESNNESDSYLDSSSGEESDRDLNSSSGEESDSDLDSSSGEESDRDLDSSSGEESNSDLDIKNLEKKKYSIIDISTKMNNKSPLRYPGGKTRACKKIDEIISKNFNMKQYNVIISPFFGGISQKKFLFY